MLNKFAIQLCWEISNNSDGYPDDRWSIKRRKCTKELHRTATFINLMLIAMTIYMTYLDEAITSSLMSKSCAMTQRTLR